MQEWNRTQQNIFTHSNRPSKVQSFAHSTPFHKLIWLWNILWSYHNWPTTAFRCVLRTSRVLEGLALHWIRSVFHLYVGSFFGYSVLSLKCACALLSIDYYVFVVYIVYIVHIVQARCARTLKSLQLNFDFYSSAASQRNRPFHDRSCAQHSQWDADGKMKKQIWYLGSLICSLLLLLLLFPPCFIHSNWLMK